MTNEPRSEGGSEPQGEAAPPGGAPASTVSLAERLKAVDRRILGGAAVAAVALVALVSVLLLSGGSEGTPPAVSVTPAGGEAPRLGPIVVTFREPPVSQEPAALVRIEPAPEGEFAWLDERTLLFQPAFPGLLRGRQYSVTVSGGTEDGGDFVQAFTVEGKLVVRSVIPAPDDSEVPSEARVFVQFSRAVAPLTLLSEASSTPVVTFDPPLAGTGEWLNTSLYTFTPTDLRPSTTYRATVAAGLSSAADGVLDEAFEWSFSTFQPALARSTPAEDTSFVPRDSAVELVFNQPMDRAASGRISLATEDGARVDAAAAWSEDGATLTLTPSSPLELSSRYLVTIPAGLPGASGGTTQREREVAFRTVDPPELTSSSPGHGETAAGRYGVYLEFNNPMDVDSVEDAVSISGFERDDWILRSWDSRTFYLDVRLEPSREYTVTIAAGARDRSGLPLPPSTITFTTGSLQPGVYFAAPPSDVGVYSAAREQELLMWATNMEEVSLTLHHVSDTQAARMLRGEGWTGNVNDPIRTWTLPVEAEQNTSVLLSTVLGEDGPLAPGYYWVTSGSPTSTRYHSSLFFMVTDTTLVTKLGLDELLVWALDTESGEPVADLVLSIDGPQVSSRAVRTDADGLATLPVPRPSEVVNTNRRFVVTTSAGGRFGVTHTDLMAGVQDWLLGVPVTYWDQPMVAHVYTDRPIYRSGETVEFKAVVRDDRDASYTLPEVGETGLSLVVTDARGNDVFRQAVTANEFGTYATSLPLSAEAPTGFYNVSIRQRVPGWEQWIANAAFQVAEFRTPEFRVEMTPRRSDVLAGEEIEVDLEAAFFFGGPLAGVDVTWSAFAYPSGISFPGYERYSFSDDDAFLTSVQDDPQRGAGELETGDDGFARITLPALLRANESTMTFQVSGTVLDQSGQAIGADTSVTVHAAGVYAGITPAGYVAQTGRASEVQVATVDIEGNPVPGQAVSVDIVQRDWITTLEETSTGTRRYVSTPRDTVLGTRSVTTDADGLGSFSYTPGSTGMLRLVARTTDGEGRTARSATYLWVGGAGAASWRVDNSGIIQPVADADRYEVGDTAEVLIPAPHPGSQALITIERGGILQREVRLVGSNSLVLEVPIEDRFVPNVFVSVVLYRAPTAADPVPRYHVGTVELPVSTQTRQLTVDLQPSVEQARPGESVEYEIRVTDWQGDPVTAEVSVAMVDAAVLSLSDLVDQDGLQAFWFQRGLGVRTASSAAASIERNNDTVSEPDEGGKGGGGPEADALRTQFRNTAFWAAQVATDADGRARVQVTLPDNLTTWRTQVRAVSGDTLVGEATDELLSTTPLLVRPALPRFLRVGDQVVLRTLVRNATDEPQEVSVSITAQGVDLDGGETQTQTVAPGASGDFAWDARATRTGTAEVAFRATAGALADGVQISLPVHLDVTPETVATGGVVEQQSAIEALYLPNYAITDRGSLEVRVQASIVGALASELRSFLPRHDRESTVRTAARVIATIAARQAEGIEGDAVWRPVEDDLRRLQTVQKGSSGWGWCATFCPADPIVTGWVLLAFGDATDAGWTTSTPQWQQGIFSIRSHLGRTSDVAAPLDPNQEAFLQYAMQQAQGGEVLSNTLRSIYERDRERLTAWGQAYLVLALLDARVPADDPAVRGLISDLNAAVLPSANGNHWEAPPLYGSIESNVSMTAVVLRALLAADEDHPLIEETARWLVAARDANRWESDIERAQAIRGLGAYAATTGERRGDFEYRVLLDNEQVLGGRLTAAAGEDASDARLDLPLSPITRGEVHRLAFERQTGAGRLYYVLNLRYVTPAAEVEALSRGLSVAREYTLVDDPDRRIAQARLGDLVRVKLTVVADADRKFVAVEDLLPAGLEALDTQLASVPEDVRRQIESERREALGDGGEFGGAWAPWYGWYWSPWEETSVRDDRFTLFATDLRRGVHEYVYFARATAIGDFFVAPATAQEGPFPEVFGRSDSGRFSVTR